MSITPRPAYRRRQVIALGGALRAAWRPALAQLRRAPAPALALLAAGLALALIGGGYLVLGLAIMPALGLALAIRGNYDNREVAGRPGEV